MPMPFFSVVIPTYNRADRLRSTVGSVLNQTFTEFEVLVMDDGSTGETSEVVKSLGDARVSYSWSENSGGPATPRNRGIDAAVADWVSFLDADDLWHPRKLEEVHKAILADPSVDAICNDEYLVLAGSGRRKRLEYGPFEPNFYRTMLVEGNRCSTSAMSVRKSFLNEHNLRFNTDSNYAIVEDYDLWLRLAKAGAKFRFLDTVLGDYLVETDNISLNKERALHNLEVLLHDHVYKLQTFEPNRDRLWRDVSVRLQIARMRQLFFSGQLRAACVLTLETMVGSPGGTAKCLLSKVKRQISVNAPV